MAKDTTSLPDDNIFKGAKTIDDVAMVIARHLAQASNYAGVLSNTWAVSDADKQNSLYNMITAGMNQIALHFQAWVNLP